MQEVQKSLERLKNKEVAGRDRIANKLLKHCRAAMTEQLTALINKIIKHHKIPEEWKKSELILLFKKGDEKQPEVSTC